MKPLSKSHVVVFTCLLALFTVATYQITDSGLDQGGDHDARVIASTIGTITGPFMGAISRGFQDCCLSFSISVAIYCAPVLSLGMFIQFLPMPDRTWARVVKMTLWVTGWLVWFGGGIVSFGHALS